MTGLQDDPRLTTFALGEGSTLKKSDLAEVEEAVRGDADVAAEVDALEAFAAQLEAELGAEACPRLDDVSRAKIERRARRGAEQGEQAAALPWYRRAPKGQLVLAASVLLLVGAAGLSSLTSAKRRSLASAERADDRATGARLAEERAAYPGDMEEAKRKILRSAEKEALAQHRTKNAHAPPRQPNTPPVREAGPPAGDPDAKDVGENPFRSVKEAPLSTFGSDVDTASYAAVRNYLKRHTLPPLRAIRLEEMVNYFDYGDAAPSKDSGTPFAVHSELGSCPWAPNHQLLRVSIKGKELDLAERPASNLVFLLDVSGSMRSPAKLPLLKRAFGLLVKQLDERDRVSIVVYAGASGVVLPPTAGDRQEQILAAFDKLRAGGSTAGGAGIELAYQVAVGEFIEGGVNRVILATDGDFNVGPRSHKALEELIAQKAKSNVFLSVLGFGMNPADGRLEALSNRGNGSYAFIDSFAEAKKVLVEQAAGTLVTIAKDLKLQVEFNPARVGAYRLLGYENRVLAAKDFNDDKKDAGDVGAGHTVTAFYELIPPGQDGVDPLKYQRPGASDELCTVRVRFKQPEAERSELREVPVRAAATSYEKTSEAFRFGSAVLAFGLTLRESEHKGQASFPLARELAQGALGADPQGRRAEMVGLITRAAELRERKR